MNNVNKYFQSEIGTTEKIVSLQPFEKIETISETKKFLKLYKLSRIGNNFFSLKRLIHKIFMIPVSKVKNCVIICIINYKNSIFIAFFVILSACFFTSTTRN